MALAEARAMGLPIVAREGGNVANLVHVETGGSLATDHAELARAFIELVRRPELLEARREKAARGALPPWTWSEAASAFIAQSVAIAP
jgi:glycosyltransferase involved in cell wall biosynthesis